MGAPVEFEAFWVKGRLQGRHLQVPADERGDKVLGIFVGIVKSFNSDKGFGFITCDDLENENGKPDVYVHSKLVGDFDMQPGVPVEFEAYWHKERLQARSLKAPEEHFDSDPDNHDSLGEFLGVVKAFYHEKGYGFIACDALKDTPQDN